MNRLTVYDPFADVFPELFRQMAQPARTGRQSVSDLRIDVIEADKQYVVSADIPGTDKDSIQVDIDGNKVSISADIKRVAEPAEGERVLRAERFQGSLARSFTLASEIDEAGAVARYENGVLMLTLPKKTAVAAKRITIN
ncbi:MAG: Hsp20/alpha crystallin family protein [Burkholderiaceae bacterium]